MGDIEGAKQLLESLTDEKREAEEIKAAAAALELAATPVDEGELAELKKKVEANPDDFEARMELAEKLNAAGQREEAMEQLLYIIEKDREWNDGAAKEKLLKFFEAWGDADPLTTEGRRRLSTILFS
jgi:putative thioredoxin